MGELLLGGADSGPVCQLCHNPTDDVDMFMDWARYGPNCVASSGDVPGPALESVAMLTDSVHASVNPAPAALGSLAPALHAPEAAVLAQQATLLAGFIDSLRLPLQELLITSTPLRRTSHQVSPVVPRRSVCIALSMHLRNPNLEVQAKKVMLRKWRTAGRSSPPWSPDPSYAERFHQTFKEPQLSSKHVAMRKLFPAGGRWSAALVARRLRDGCCLSRNLYL